MYYRSSETSLQAGQLGPRGYRIFQFCPACVFGIKPVVSLGRIDSAARSEYSQDVSVVLVVLSE